MASNADQDTLDLQDRLRLNEDLVASRAQLSGAWTAAVAARFGHFGLLVGLFFLIVIVPRTLLDITVFDPAVLTSSPQATSLTVGALLLLDYLGRTLLQGLRASLYRQLEEGTASVGTWREHIALSATRIPRIIYLDVVGLLGTLVGTLLLVIPGLLVAGWMGPIRHLVTTGACGPIEGFKQGVALTGRHRSTITWRLVKRIGWRLGLLLLVGAVWFLLLRYAPLYLPPTVGGLLVVFFLARTPFQYFSLLDDLAFYATIEEREGRLEIARH